MSTIADYELIDHGIEHSQYFQGCGTAFTPFDHVATGIGDNFAEAMDDALEMAAQRPDTDGVDWDALETRIRADYFDSKPFPTNPSVQMHWDGLRTTDDDGNPIDDDDNDNDDCNELYYHVSIRFNLM